jgi:twitching motility protein PilT
MNATKAIFEYLVKTKGASSIIIAPGAPPVTKTAEGLNVALNLVLSAEDVRETLRALRRLRPQASLVSLSSALGSLAEHVEKTTDAKGPDASGTFSLGITDVGRFRVSYLTQRGTKILSIVGIPYEIPELEQICDDPSVAAALRQLVTSGEGGILAVSGPSVVSNSLMVYSLLRGTNDKRRGILYVLERSLTFLMRHGNSIVIQSELGADVDTLEEGIRSILPFQPDIVYVGDIWPGDEIPSLRFMVANRGTTTVVSSGAMSGEQLLKSFAPPDSFREAERDNVIRAIAEVRALSSGKLSVRLTQQPPA